MKLEEAHKLADWRLLAWLMGIIVVLFALWTFPKWQVAYTKNLTPEQRFDRENEARRTWLKSSEEEFYLSVSTLLGGS